jgi:hypothetical protein
MDHVEIEPHGDKFRVLVRGTWGVGVDFPTERGAQMVATAIELAQLDTEGSI